MRRRSPLSYLTVVGALVVLAFATAPNDSVARFPTGSVYTASAPPPPYVGLGDVKSGAYGYWGLRAYTVAKATAHVNAIDLRRDDAATCTVKYWDDGGLDLTNTALCNSSTQTVTAWMSGHTATISQFYDNVSTNHFTQTTAATQASFKLPGACPGTMPASKPCAVNASGGYYFVGAGFNTGPPYTLIGTFYEGSSPATGGRLFSSSGFTYQTIAKDTGDCTTSKLAAYLGTVLCSSAAYTTQKWYSFQNCAGSSTGCNGGVGAITYGTTTTTGSTGTTALIVVNFIWMADAIFGNSFVGAFTELGFYAAGETSGEISSIQANIDNYWGY